MLVQWHGIHQQGPAMANRAPFFAAFVGFSLVLMAPAGRAEDQSERIEAAKVLVARLTANEFAKAVEPFDDTMRRVLPSEALKSVWEQTSRPYGSFRQITATRVETAKEFTIVYVTLTFERGALEAKIAFRSDGRITGFFVVPASKYSPPPYVQPEAFEEIEMRVGRGFFPLAGTLALPKGDGPFPAVVLVHGSGPHDRDESIGPNKPFRDLAQGLASRGIAVLRYEKRTRQYSLVMALRLGALTVREETVDDAAAAVAALAAQPKIDARRIYVLGHSLGGTLLPRIAQASDGVAGFISLAGSTRPLEDHILEQTRYLLTLAGPPSDEQAAALAEIERQVAKVKSPDLSPETSITELPLGIAPRYWLDLRGYDPAEAAKAIQRPLLILQGERDYQVTMTDFARWKEALQGRSDVRFISYPALNHLFMTGEGKSSPGEYGVPGNVDEAVVRDIAEWIQGR